MLQLPCVAVLCCLHLVMQTLAMSCHEGEHEAIAQSLALLTSSRASFLLLPCSRRCGAVRCTRTGASSLPQIKGAVTGTVQWAHNGAHVVACCVCKTESIVPPVGLLLGHPHARPMCITGSALCMHVRCPAHCWATGLLGLIARLCVCAPSS